MKFEWRTLEDERPDAIEPLPAEERERGGRRWPAVLVVVLLVGVVAWGGYRALNRRAMEAAAAVETDVRSSERLVRQAAAQADGELFASLLSGRDTEWANQYQQMLLDGTLMNRPAFGLTWQPVEPRAVTVTLAPNLTEAEVSADLFYTVQQGDGETATVTLRQTHIYQLGRQRWLLAQPDEAFWGQPVTIALDRVVVTAPERDETIARQLAADLDAIIGDVCASPYALNCPARIQLKVILTNNPYFLSTVIPPSGSGWLAIGDPLEVGIGLPTPTLVGTPTDEASYQALRRGYGALLADVLITHLYGWPCCNQLYEALVDAQLAELGLRPWPLGPAAYRHFLAQPPSLAQLVEQLRAAAIGRRSAYALVEFMRHQDRDIPLTAVNRHILSLARQYEWNTLRHLLGIRLMSEIEERAWLQFIYERSATAQTAAAPAEDVQLLCRQSTELSSLYRLDTLMNQWQAEIGGRERAGRPFVSMIALPGGRGVVLEEEPHDGLARTILWQEGQETIAYANTASFGPLTFFDRVDPAGQQLLVSIPNERGANSFRLVNLNECEADGCAAVKIDGFPFWSPDGTKTLLIGRQARLFLADGSGQNPVRVGTGSSPVWLDNERYGFLYWRQEQVANTLVQKSQLMIAAAPGEEPERTLTGEHLRAAMPEAERPASMNPLLAVANPTQAGQLVLVSARDGGAVRLFYLFVYDYDAGTLSLRLSLEGVPTGLRFSPDGRWLAVTTIDDRRKMGALYLHEVATSLTQIYRHALPETAEGWSADWSADGRWLALPTQRMVILLNPDEDSQRWLVHAYGNCGTVVWVAR